MPYKDPAAEKAYRTAYNLRNAEKIRARKAALYALNIENERAKRRAYRSKNAAKISAKGVREKGDR